MAVSIDYVARETASNLWRNLFMTIAAVLTVAVSLSLAGAVLLLKQEAAQATTKWQHNVNVIVFLCPSGGTGVPATSSGSANGSCTTGDTTGSTTSASAPVPTSMTPQQAAINTQLEQLPYVKTCTFRNQAYDYNEAIHSLGSDIGQGLSVASTPASLRCALTDPNQIQSIQREFKGFPEVEAVEGPTAQVKTMERVIGIVGVVFLTLAIVLLLSASVLILNTIRLAIFARRREVSVMKLVGATNWFIRIPFMCEGLVQGLMGGIVAVLAVLLLHWVLNNAAGNDPGSFFFQARTPMPEVLVTCGVVMLVGLVIGALGSALGIRRFLDT